MVEAALTQVKPRFEITVEDDIKKLDGRMRSGHRESNY
jgi:hypothetical protein